MGYSNDVYLFTFQKEGGRKSRENTSEKCFPNKVMSNKAQQKLEGKKKEK